MRLPTLSSRSLSSLAIAACVAVSIFTTDAFAQPKTEADAKMRFEAGVALITDSAGARWEEGYTQFRLAYQIFTELKSPKAWKVLGNLGLSAMNIERDGEAIEAYTKYLAEGGSNISASEKAQIERDLSTLKVGVVYVTLKSDTAGIQVTDTRQGTKGVTVLSYEVGPTPIKVGARAGLHTFVAKSGGKEDRWEIKLEPGQTVEHAFNFSTSATPVPVPVPTDTTKPATTAAPPPTTQPTTAPTTPPPPPATKSSGSPLRTAGYVTTGVGGALLIGGVVTGLIGKGKYNSAKDKCVDGGNRCPESTKSDFDSASSMATLTNVFLISGGVLAAGGVTMIVLGGPKKETSAQTGPNMALAPVAMPGGGGFFAQGSF